jgi:hypothetical protein
MPYIYKDSPDWREKSASAFTDSFSRSLEATMLRKQKKEDEAKKLQEQIALGGYVDIPSGDSSDNYESVIDLGGKKLGKPLSEYDKKKRSAELKVLERKGTEPSLQELLTQAAGVQAMAPEGTTIRKGGLTIPLKPAPKSDLAERKFQTTLSDKEVEKQAKSDIVKQSANDMLDAISNVEQGINYFGPLTGNIPGVPIADRIKWEANINKLLSSNVLNLLNQMKSASRTGASGFGQLSEKELKVLQDASTELKRNLAPEDAQTILNKMKIRLEKIIGANTSLQQPQGTQGGRIKVKDKATGQTGTIEAEEFDPNIYEQL